MIALLTECGFGTSASLQPGLVRQRHRRRPDRSEPRVGRRHRPVSLRRRRRQRGAWRATGGSPRARSRSTTMPTSTASPSIRTTTARANTVMFSASDGGVDRIDDARAPVNTTLAQMCGDTPVAGGATWIDRNNGYVTTQFYDGAVYPDGQSLLRRPAGQRHAAGDQRRARPGRMLPAATAATSAVDTLGDAEPGNDVLFAENTGLSHPEVARTAAPRFISAISGIDDAGFLFICAVHDERRRSSSTCGRAAAYIWRTTNQAASLARASAITCGERLGLGDCRAPARPESRARRHVRRLLSTTTTPRSRRRHHGSGRRRDHRHGYISSDRLGSDQRQRRLRDGVERSAAPTCLKSINGGVVVGDERRQRRDGPAADSRAAGSS